MSLSLSLKKIVEDAASNQLAQRLALSVLDVGKLALKSNQTWQQLLVFSNRSVQTDSLKLELQLFSNRFSDNPVGRLSISQIGFSTLSGKAEGPFELELRIVDCNSCRVASIDGRSFIL